MKELGVPVREQKHERKIVSSQIRPHQITFVVNNNIAKEQLFKLIQFNTHIWGGFYNTFIPTDGTNITDDWWYLMQLADPDIVCLVGDISANLKNEIIEKTPTLSIGEWNDNILDSLLKEHISRQLRIVPIQNVIIAQTKGKYISDKSNILIPRYNEDNPLSPYLKYIFGYPTAKFIDWYQKGLKAEVINIDNQNLDNYLEMQRKSIERLTPINLTTMMLRTTLHGTLLNAGNVLYIFSIGEKFIGDFCLYWYFKRYIHPDILLLPENILFNDDNLKQLKNWLDKVYPHKNIINIFSSSLDLENVKLLGAKLEQNLGLEYVYDITFKNFDEINIGHIAIKEKDTITEEVEFVDTKCRIKANKPISFEQTQVTSWITDIDIQGTINRYDGYKLPKRSEFMSLFRDTTNRYPRNDKKISDIFSFSIPVYDNDKFINLELMEPSLLLRNLFKKYGCEIELLEVNKYCSGMLKLAGSLSFLTIFQEKGVRDLFRALSFPSVSLNLNEIKGYLKYGDDGRKAGNLITSLSVRNILIRGYNLRCPHCDLNKWYPLDEIKEIMICSGCLSKFQIPPRLDFHYRLNDLFARGISDCGVIPIILTMILLSNISEESFLFLVGVKITSPMETDIDLVAICDREIIFCECKDLENGVTEITVNEIQKQFEIINNLSNQIGNRILLLCSLVADTNKTLFDNFINKFPSKEKINIKLLFSSELQKGSIEDILSILYLLPKPIYKESSIKFGKKSDTISYTF
jgi:hypothetical protein